MLKRDIVYLLILLSLIGVLYTENASANETANTPYNIGLTTTVARVFATLMEIAPYISMILIVLGGITYAISISQPADSRGKLQSMAIGMVIGGIIIAAFAFGAEQIEKGSEGLLTG